jgi:O-antigen ligase
MKTALVARRDVAFWLGFAALMAMVAVAATRSALLALLFAAAIGLVAILVVVLSTKGGQLVFLALILGAAVIIPEEVSLTYRIPLAGGGIFISDILLGLLMVAWAVNLLSRGEVRMVKTPVAVALVVFLAWVAFSCVSGIVAGNELRFVLQDLRSLLYFTLFFWVVTEVDDRRTLLRVLGVLGGVVVAGFITGLVSTALGRGNETGFVEAGVTRFPAPNEVFLMGAVLALSWIVMWPRGRRQPRVLWFILAVSAVGLAISLVRGFYVGLAVAVALLLVVLRTRQRLRLIAGVLVATLVLAVAGLLFAPTLVESVATRAAAVTEVGDRNVQYRFLENQSAMRSIRERPVLGNGLGATYVADFSRYGIPLETETYIHNNYLWFLHRLGAVGLLVFGWVMVAFLRPRRWLAVARGAVDPVTGGMVVGGRVLIAALLVVSITSPQFNNKADAALVALVMGLSEVALALAAREIDTGKEDDSPVWARPAGDRDPFF